MSPWLQRAVILSAVCLALTACVTTTTSGSKSKVDKNKALQAYVQLGVRYLKADNRDAARRSFIKAMDLDPKSPEANHGIALLYRQDGELKLAEQHFLKALRISPNYSQAHNNYGDFLFAAGRYEEAYKHFNRASDNVEYQGRPLALLNVGRTALKLDNKPRAKAVFEQALNINKQFTPVMLELAQLNFDNKDYAEAKKYLDNFTEYSKHTAQSLWLGIRIERIFGNRDKEASYGLLLKNMHPYSKEYLEYKQDIGQ